MLRLFIIAVIFFLTLAFYVIAIESLEWYEESPIVNKVTPLSLANGAIKTKFPGRTPAPYPNGWFMVMLSQDIKPNEVKTAHIMGQDVVVFRQADGEAFVVDAFCPHLGAHLGGATVTENGIRCPFHGWEFNCKNECTAAYTNQIPSTATLKFWRKIEINKMIFVYYHADNQEPSWFPVELPEVNEGIFEYHGRSEHRVRCHPQEIFENGPDFVHLSVVHHTVSPFDIPGSTHHLDAVWDTDSHDKHISQMRVDHKIGMFGIKMEIMNRPVIVRQVGPGFCSLEFDSKWGKWTVTQAVTPLSNGVTHVHHSVYSNMSRLMTKFVFYGMVFQVEQDIPIWNNKTYQHQPCVVKNDVEQDIPIWDNKTYQHQPCVVKNDGPIQKFRRWYHQFYSENSDQVWRKDNSLNLDW